jgi:uncharacterized FAD-dependent dehydrogenase
MKTITRITVALEERFDEEKHLELLAKAVGVPTTSIRYFKLTSAALDARGGRQRFHLNFEVWVDEDFNQLESQWDLELQNVGSAEPVLIIGFGPAGMFAALKLIELGYKPIVIERGKSVRERRKDIAVLTKKGIVNPESNYCFGEGGAGTFSDGKLYTRAHKRGSIERILNIFHLFGAAEEILIDTHPHIGTNKLPAVVQKLREKVIECGGEVLFDTKVCDLQNDSDRFKAVTTQSGEKIAAKAAILATGHSARDIFELLQKKKILINLKPFALGVRVEHPQLMVDHAQYRTSSRHPNLPASSYALRAQIEQRGVYSFCMCPGGIICPAATSDGEIVVNGWSPSKRNSYFANSGIVVEILAEDLTDYQEHGELAALRFQQEIEKRAFVAGGGKQVAPAQRLSDFARGRASKDLPKCSYLPGIVPADLEALLPSFVSIRLKAAVKQFENSLTGFISDEAVVVATESRTSSPVRIPRDPNTLCHPAVAGLFPCGEGAGYAGGILSAAMDGERVAQAVAAYLK